MSQSSHAAFRASLLAKIPWFYHPLLHFISTFGSTIAIIAVTWHYLTVSLSFIFCVLVPFILIPTWLYANHFEYWMHKNVFHRPLFWPLDVFFRRHTEHHQLYHEENPVIKEWRELRHVLMPWYAIFSFFLIAGAGAALIGFFAHLLFGNEIGWNVGLFTLLSQAAYVGQYEFLHMLYHIPNSPRAISWLSEHHQTHHHRSNAHQWNFNITYPLFDALRGTLWRRQR